MAEMKQEYLEKLFDLIELQEVLFASSQFGLSGLGEWTIIDKPYRSHFARRHSRMLLKFDERYNDWDDYTFSLKMYVRLTWLFDLLDLPTKRDAVRGLYSQLAMCGRGVGDSWYTTDAVYKIWPEFNEAAWSLLEQEIRRHTSPYDYESKQEEMLTCLKPGGDYKGFLPRS